MPSPAGLRKDGALTKDVLNLLQYQLQANATPVQLTNPTVATDLMTYPVPTDLLNAIGAGIEIFAAGVYNLGLASTLVFTIKLAGVTIATFTTAAQATIGVTLGWNVTVVATVVGAGANASLEVHGELNFDSGATLAAACSTFLDSNTAAITGVNLNPQMPPATALLEVMANLGSGNAGSTITERLLTVQLLG